MAFEKEFLSGRRKHLVNKLRATKEAMNRSGILAKHRHYKEAVLIPQILSAFKRLDKGTYGICPDCLEDIPQERLLLHPHVLRCVPCQEGRDIRYGYH